MARRWAAISRPPRRSLAAAAGALLAGAAASALLGLLCGEPAAATDADALAPAERAAILALGPWPLAPVHDAANPASGLPAGVALGETLFFSPRLSPTGLRCASCHEPWRHFADGRGVAQGVAAGSRNTPSLLDAARHRRYGWDGARDALWSQSLRPLQDPREMPASDEQVAALMRGDAALSARYAAVFGAAPSADDARVTRDVGLALAAYVETLASPRTPFDDWRDRLAGAGDGIEPSTSGAFPAAARRGLRLFVGRAGCAACHAGPTLGDDAFHVSLVRSMTAPGVPDPGHGGEPANAFRTPGLRDVAATGPWLHDGSAARLCDAVRPHAADPESAAPALTAAERRDLVAFLRTLSTDAPEGEATASCDDR
jgi:cytochrome c peroxidase